MFLKLSIQNFEKKQEIVKKSCIIIIKAKKGTVPPEGLFQIK